MRTREARNFAHSFAAGLVANAKVHFQVNSGLMALQKYCYGAGKHKD